LKKDFINFCLRDVDYSKAKNLRSKKMCEKIISGKIIVLIYSGFNLDTALLRYMFLNPFFNH